MSTLAGDRHHDHYRDSWYEQALAEDQHRVESERLVDQMAQEYPESHAEGSQSVATPMQALDHLTRQYTPVTEADHKAMFVLRQFVTGNDCWSETHYQAHLRRNRLAAAEQAATQRVNDRRMGE